jgi:hypothetical protein
MAPFGRAPLPDSSALLLDSPIQWFHWIPRGSRVGSWWELILCWSPPEYNREQGQAGFFSSQLLV